MAQLIKLQDYVSRYETDLYRYPSQFVRLKKQQWEKMKLHWESGGTFSSPEKEEIEKEKSSVTRKFISFFKKKENDESGEDASLMQKDDDEIELEMGMHPDITSEEELKKHFLDSVFEFQLRWASSTISEKSYVDNSYCYDERLKYLLQRFPDNTLVLYYPVFKIKNAPVELEVILITPTGIWCLSFLEFEDGTAYIGSGDRFWEKKWGDSETRVLNPLISLRRMERIIQQIVEYAGVELPVHKAVLSRNGYVDYPQAPAGYRFIDKRTHESWFNQQRSSRSPIKSVQLKAAKAILEYCQTTSFKRMHYQHETLKEWNAAAEEDSQ
ncbi:nuclease-related domain-containing protein [Bacillus sp. Marseille-Q1617]|uniref:nuclease-related domain-containing protein n=1 Tax=Bacillus sp. Marseille-Q1617 TaxID=2736887 RepID=UPI00158D6E42|nr:nuclease-related domain-containing protein [Bacillus sp. Marseille-Q1617]